MGLSRYIHDGRVEHPSDPALEVKRLQRCMNDMIGVLALPAAWRGREPAEILSTLADSLMGMFRLDLVYAHVIIEADKEPLKVVRAGPSHRTDEIAHSLDDWLKEQQFGQASQTQLTIAGQQISIVPMGMGVEGALGFIVVGSGRVGFPQQTERVVLNVAANQTAAVLQQVQHLNEQKQVASELDRRVAERTRELAKANEELQLQVGLLQHLPVSAWTLAPDGTPDFVNRVWLEFSGQSLEFVRSHPEAWMTAVHPDDREVASRTFWDGVRAGRGFAFETRSLRAQDGTYRWHLQQAVVMRDAEGIVLKFVGTTTDIDDQKRAEEALRASEASLRQVIDNIPGLVSTLGPNGETRLINRQILEYFGKSYEELTNWRLSDAIHPDDLPRIIALHAQSIRSGAPFGSEYRLRRVDGVYRWFQFRAEPVREAAGGVIGWYVLATDIHDRKQAEEALQASEHNFASIINTIPTLAWSARPDGYCDFLSQGWLDYAGLTQSEAHGWGWANAIHRDDLERVHEYWQSHILSGEPGEIEARLRRFDGSYRWFLFRASPLRNESGAIIKWYGTNMDIDGRKQAEEALTRARAELAHVARITSLGVLTASIAHEVNQPLSGVVTNAGTCLRMLESNPPNIEGARETARRTIRDGNRASEVVTRLRALFKSKEVVAERVDLNEAAREVIALSSTELESKRIILRHEFAENLPAVMGDRIQLQQVIQNLLRNASDSMSEIDDRPRQLSIRTECDDGGNVRLTVRDTGVGIAPEAADRLFDPLFTTKKEGMGIGLSVCRSIVEAHRGQLWAAANAGPGSSFVFSIPSDPSG